MSVAVDGWYGTVTTVSSDTTISDEEVLLVDTSSADVTITLPPPTSGDIYAVKKTTSANTLTIDTPGSQTIDDNSTLTVEVHYAAVSMASDGTDYYVL